MIYVWKDENSGKIIEVDRSMAESDVEPSIEESEMDEDEFLAANWRKIVTGGSCSIGFGLKGHW